MCHVESPRWQIKILKQTLKYTHKLNKAPDQTKKVFICWQMMAIEGGRQIFLWREMHCFSSRIKKTLCQFVTHLTTNRNLKQGLQRKLQWLGKIMWEQPIFRYAGFKTQRALETNISTLHMVWKETGNQYRWNETGVVRPFDIPSQNFCHSIQDFYSFPGIHWKHKDRAECNSCTGDSPAWISRNLSPLASSKC